MPLHVLQLLLLLVVVMVVVVYVVGVGGVAAAGVTLDNAEQHAGNKRTADQLDGVDVRTAKRRTVGSAYDCGLCAPMDVRAVDACKKVLNAAGFLMGCMSLLCLALKKGHRGITSLSPETMVQYLDKGGINTCAGRCECLEAFLYHYHGSASLPTVVVQLMGVGMLRDSAVAWYVCMAGLQVPGDEALYMLNRVSSFMKASWAVLKCNGRMLLLHC
jgi:hypothetical protein